MNLDYIFWEDIPADEFIVKRLADDDSEETLTFARDENYRLICDIKMPQGNIFSWDKNFGRDIKGGAQSYGIQTIEAVTRMGGFRAKLEIFPVGDKKFSPKELTYKPEALSITLCPNATSGNETKTIVYFFLSNMGNGNIWFPSKMSFETSGKARVQMADVVDDLIDRPMVSAHCSGCFKLSINGKTFILGKADKKSEKKLGGVFLRFDGRDNFPTDVEVSIITDFLAYIAGSEIIYIGNVKFGENYSLNEQVFLSTHRRDVKVAMSIFPMPVIPLGLEMVENRGVPTINEGELSALLSKYSKNKDIFSLDYIGYYIKCFRHVSIDIQMHPLATAFDLIQKAWFKSEKSHSKGKPITDVEFGKVLSKYLPLIESDLALYPKKDKIIKKIKMANELTLNDRLNIFFEEIGLNIGEIERTIIKERHRSIHGDLNGKDYQKLLFSVYGAYSLLNRIILKIIGYAGDYIDYSTYDLAYNFPHKNINEPLRGVSDQK